ncbi:30S ribosomal protein S13p/S18e [Colletotrichum tamarilloi]|uniref:30S ribosomal protein S13p/S18e n=1 Tax=Colletotrichum tamarilloi TaxID=1209934 RepID=A0ABQ9RHM2_9PEZI|nr:30S ribosomal protein S13p/S18e [Colletotrichum tamarilloi]KAK1504030.1 30S ribosomal protein S13p/S18e [Colletotrichum tamarilloi]
MGGGNPWKWMRPWHKGSPSGRISAINAPGQPLVSLDYVQHLPPPRYNWIHYFPAPTLRECIDDFEVSRSHHQLQAPDQPAATIVTLFSRTQVFILGVNFSEQKLVKKALESFFALGPTTSSRILAKYSISPMSKVGALPPKTVTALTAELSTMTIESDARKIIQQNVMRLKDMGSYRGRRHAMNLPVRGQRTRTQIESARKHNSANRRW